MSNTTYQEVIQSFESSFQDKVELPASLVKVWFDKALGRYCVELDNLIFDYDLMVFNDRLDRYVIDTLAEFMKQLYQEREVSKVNKRVSIVTKELSIDGNNGSKKAAEGELSYVTSKSSEMVENQKPTAFV